MRRIPTGTPCAGPTTSRSAHLEHTRLHVQPRGPAPSRNASATTTGCPRVLIHHNPQSPLSGLTRLQLFHTGQAQVACFPSAQPHKHFDVRAHCTNTDQAPAFRLPKHEQAHTNICSQHTRPQNTAKRGYPSRSTRGCLAQITPSTHHRQRQCLDERSRNLKPLSAHPDARSLLPVDC